MEAIVFVSSPPLSFDIVTSAWTQRKTKGDKGRGRERDYRSREKQREVKGGRDTSEGSRAENLARGKETEL